MPRLSFSRRNKTVRNIGTAKIILDCYAVNGSQWRKNYYFALLFVIVNQILHIHSKTPFPLLKALRGKPIFPSVIAN
jgi:hypothetical protein